MTSPPPAPPAIAENEVHAEAHIVGVATRALIHTDDMIGTALVDKHGHKVRLWTDAQTAERVIDAIRIGLNAVFERRAKYGPAPLTVPAPETILDAYIVQAGYTADASKVLLRFVCRNTGTQVAALSEKAAQELLDGLPKVLAEMRKQRAAPRN